jgi:hypothetical protein
MDETKYGVLLKALKACEKNYHSHVREFGKLDKTDIAFWSEQLSDLSPERLERCFSEHIKTSAFFPTVKDIREGTQDNPRRKPCEDHKYLDSLNQSRLLTGPERAKMGMPDRMKEIFRKLQQEVANANH